MIMNPFKKLGKIIVDVAETTTDIVEDIVDGSDEPTPQPQRCATDFIED